MGSVRILLWVGFGEMGGAGSGSRGVAMRDASNALGAAAVWEEARLRVKRFWGGRVGDEARCWFPCRAHYELERG